MSQNDQIWRRVEVLERSAWRKKKLVGNTTVVQEIVGIWAKPKARWRKVSSDKNIK